MVGTSFKSSYSDPYSDPTYIDEEPLIGSGISEKAHHLETCLKELVGTDYESVAKSINEGKMVRVDSIKDLEPDTVLFIINKNVRGQERECRYEEVRNLAQDSTYYYYIFRSATPEELEEKQKEQLRKKKESEDKNLES